MVKALPKGQSGAHTHTHARLQHFGLEHNHNKRFARVALAVCSEAADGERELGQCAYKTAMKN